MKRTGLSRSSPALSAGFSLRQYSMDRKRLQPVKVASASSFTLEEIDRMGGNGAWRQKLAHEDFERKKIEEAERARLQKIADEEKRMRKEKLQAKRRKQMEEEEAQRRAEREKEQREREEREDAKRKQEEQERREREAAEKDWHARQPKTCKTCQGSGICQGCEGKGHIFAMFLVPQSSPGFEGGRVQQGCDACGGYRQNLYADMQKGSGKCAPCSGVGKIKPVVLEKGGTRRFLDGRSPGGDLSPKMRKSAGAFGMEN